MKLKRLFVFALPLMTMGITSCGGSPSSSPAASSEAVSGSEQVSVEEVSSALPYKGDLPRYDASKYKDCFVIHYHRYDGDYDNWSLWLWDHGNNGEGAEYLPVAYDDYGSVFAYPLSTWSPGNWSKLDIGIIVKTKGSWNAKDPDGDRFVTMSNLTLDENRNYSVWTWTEVTAIYDHEVAVPYYLRQVSFDDFNTLYVLSGIGNIQKIVLYRDGKKAQEWSYSAAEAKRSNTLTLDEPASLEHSFTVEATYGNGTVLSSPVDVSTLYETKDFKDKYNYEGELGALYTEAKTTFRVWSPVSTSIKLRIYDNGTPKSLDETRGDDTYKEYDMVRGEKGTWSYEYEGDANGKYYTYFVTNYKFNGREIVDPYAKAAGVNGVRGMVLDFADTDPEGWDEMEMAHQIDPKALTVYETHVVDLTSHETWGGTASKAKTYLGMVEEGTTYTPDGGEAVTTGFDHIKELGVNAVQLQPMFDHANDERDGKRSFNWGYNPLNYNVLEGSYSSDPYDGAVRVREFKTAVKAFYDADINVIMDVVYNHVNSVDGQNFDVLAPGYFFRYTGAGALSNGSGCGNETASDRSMFRKFMIDSTEFLAKEYKLGGFRFDLMALHDLDSMEAVAANLHEYNPKLAVYGEPWTGGGSTLPSAKQASQANGNSFVGYAQFNDGMRDALVKSGMKGKTETGIGYGQTAKMNASDLSAVEKGLKGFTASGSNLIQDAKKTVNYITCHDNYTFYDRVYAYEDGRKFEEHTSDEQVAKLNLFSQAFVMLSHGTSFMLAGEEMLRSKFEQTPEELTVAQRLEYAHNTYTTTKVGDVEIDGYVVNALDYSRKVEFADLFENYKRLVDFKINLSALHDDVHVNGTDDDTSALVTVKHDKGYTQIVESFVSDGYDYVIYFNAPGADAPVADLTGYNIIYDSVDPAVTLESPATGSAETAFERCEILVARKAA